MATQSRFFLERSGWALAYAWSGVAVMWAFWISFVIFLASPRKLLDYWPLPTVDHGDAYPASLAALIDLGLITLFGLQHSLMARPRFKTAVISHLPSAFERCTYVHMANVALFTLIIFWQPVPIEVWDVDRGPWKDAVWTIFAIGWLILFLELGHSGSPNCSALLKCVDGQVARPTISHSSGPASRIDGCAIPCTLVCSWAFGPRHA
jgi:hypothetical protein